MEPPVKLVHNATVLIASTKTLERAYPDFPKGKLWRVLRDRGGKKDTRGRWTGPVTVKEFKRAWPVVSEAEIRRWAAPTSTTDKADAKAIIEMRERGWYDNGRSTTQRVTFMTPRMAVTKAIEYVEEGGVPDYLVNIRQVGKDRWRLYLDRTS